MISKEYFKSEDFKRHMFYTSIALFLTTILLSGLLYGAFMLVADIVFILIGFAAFSMGSDTWIVGVFWLASPLLFAAWYHYSRAPKVSLTCACISLVCWAVILPFSITADLSGSTAEFCGICAIYALGLLSIMVITAALIIELETQPKPEVLAYENES